MKDRDSFILFFLISLLLHLFLVLTSASYLKKVEVEKSPQMEVVLLSQKYQIADIEPPEKEEKPKQAKFMGLYDSTVEKETVSEYRSERIHSGRSNGVSALTNGPADGGFRGREGSTPEQKDDFFDRVPGDFFPDYKKGDRTYLNVLRFPKIEYFVRLKKIFRTTFNPVPPLRASLMTTQISKGQVEVKLAVSIDRSGRLDELFVINSSGLPLYDEEALRTIKASSPFATPPANLLDSSSKLRMVWTFTVYL